MLKIPLNIKNLKKILSSDNNSSLNQKNKLPDNWIDFVRLLKIRSGNKIVNFEPYNYQIKISDLIDDHYGTVIVKSRQLGITQLVASKFLFKASLNPAYVALILSKTQDDTSKIAHRVREMLMSLTEYVETENDNLTSIRIKHGGQLFFRNSRIDGARGIDSVSDVLFDEAAFIEDLEHIYSAVIPCLEMVGDDARIVILSTPNGQSGWFYNQVISNNLSDKNIIDITNKIRNKDFSPLYHWSDDSNWAKIFLHWRAHPVYSENSNYLDDIAIKKKLPIEKVKQEYDLSFTDSLEMVFNPHLVKDVSILDYEKVYLKECDYYLGIDTATTGSDFFVCVVIKHDLKTNKYYLVDIYRKRN